MKLNLPHMHFDSVENILLLTTSINTDEFITIYVLANNQYEGHFSIFIRSPSLSLRSNGEGFHLSGDFTIPGDFTLPLPPTYHS
jgi:uncharacterized membrane protein YobD (UPF0266 family)